MTNTETIEDRKNKTVKTLATMLDYLGLDAVLKAEATEDRITITITSEDAGRIIGRKGQSLDSLQMLINRMMFKGDQEFPRVYLDIDGYNRKNPRRPRKESGRKYQSEYVENIDEEKLTLQAQDAAKEVKRWGEPVVLPAMSAKERRIIHISLQDDPELKTESEGDGRRKKVIISLK